jgi:hypothetical protein
MKKILINFNKEYRLPCLRSAVFFYFAPVQSVILQKDGTFFKNECVMVDENRRV